MSKDLLSIEEVKLDQPMYIIYEVQNENLVDVYEIATSKIMLDSLAKANMYDKTVMQLDKVYLANLTEPDYDRLIDEDEAIKIVSSKVNTEIKFLNTINNMRKWQFTSIVFSKNQPQHYFFRLSDLREVEDVHVKGIVDNNRKKREKIKLIDTLLRDNIHSMLDSYGLVLEGNSIVVKKDLVQKLLNDHLAKVQNDFKELGINLNIKDTSFLKTVAGTLKVADLTESNFETK
jgi:hypothetical protein